MTRTKTSFWIIVVVAVVVFWIYGSPTITRHRTLPENTYVLQGDWDAIQATITYSAGAHKPKPFVEDDEHWETKIIVKPGDLITIIIKPHLPGKTFKTHCFIRDRHWQIVNQNAAAWDEKGGQVLCSYIAK